MREQEWEEVASVFILLPRQAPGGLGAPSSEPRLLRPEGPSSWPRPSTEVGLSRGPASSNPGVATLATPPDRSMPS